MQPIPFPPASEVHFDLEGVSVRTDVIKIYILEYFTSEALVPSSRIFDGHAGN